MGNHTKKEPRVKPAKPYPEFPPFLHDTGRWAKKVRGQLQYFGPWEDWQAALNKWLDQKDELMAGRKPQAANGEVTVRDLVNAFLTSKENAMGEGHPTQRSFRDYNATCARTIKCFGLRRTASNLGPADFRGFVQVMQDWTPVTRSNEIQRVRSIFKYAYESALLERPMNFGPDFKKPSAKIIRTSKIVRADKSRRPARLFTKKDIRWHHAPATSIIAASHRSGSSRTSAKSQPD